MRYWRHGFVNALSIQSLKEAGIELTQVEKDRLIRAWSDALEAGIELERILVPKVGQAVLDEAKIVRSSG